MQIFKTQDGEIIVIEEGDSLEQFIDDNLCENGEEAYRTNEGEYTLFIDGKFSRVISLEQVGYRKVSEFVDAQVIEDGGQYGVMVCRGHKSACVGFDTIEECLNYIDSL